MDRLLTERDAALEVDPTFSGMPQSFIDWTWQTWLPSHLHRYETPGAGTPQLPQLQDR